jgi:predicted nucleic acid-binding protein
MEILIETSAVMAVIIKEPEKDIIIGLTKDAVLVSPNIVSIEIANALSKMMKRKIIEKERMMNAFQYFKAIPVKNIDINFENALKIAYDYKIYAYDACYLETAKRLNLSLLTFDGNMIKVGKEFGINILGVKNVNI